MAEFLRTLIQIAEAVAAHKLAQAIPGWLAIVFVSFFLVLLAFAYRRRAYAPHGGRTHIRMGIEIAFWLRRSSSDRRNNREAGG